MKWQKNKSIWVDTTNMDEYPSLQNDTWCDVLVVGGGICGVLIAHELAQRGINSILVEKNRLGMGASRNTTAVVSVVEDFFYFDLIREKGFETASKYLNSKLEAIKLYKNLARYYDFDFEEIEEIKYSKGDDKTLIKEIEALKSLGFDATISSNTFNGEEVKGILLPKQAQFNPLKLINQLASNIEVYENTKILKVDKSYAYTKNYKIRYNQIVFATHFPFIKRYGLYFMKLYQQKSYVAAYKNNEKYCYLNIDKNGFYTRSYKDYLLVGGEDSRVGKCHNEGNNFLNRINQDFSTKPNYLWQNQDTVSLDNLPYIGYYSLFKKNMYVATGFNLWGMANSMIASMLISDLIEKKDNEYRKLFSPQRFYINKQLFINIGSSLGNYLRIGKRCSHMGCALKKNNSEHTYECQCHGSRFDCEGNVLNGPADKDI